MKKYNYFLLVLLLFTGVLKTNAQAITYSFVNAQITNDGVDDFYEADIQLATDTDFKLGIGQFFLNYNTAAFGSNIEASGNLIFLHPDGVGGTYILDERFAGALNVYVPNGNPVDTEKYEYKKEWLKKFISKIKKKIQKNSNILIAGDFNIIPEEIDVHDFKRYENDALGRLEIRKKYRELINLGFKDVYRFINKTKQEYTFWDYFAGSWQKNYGMRIDHFLLSNSLIDNIKSININKKPRSNEKPSDHTPIELQII